MKLLQTATELQPGSRKVCLAIGVFDGVHLGHQQIIRQTIAAARLMGADCIISGIRPQIAQTIVHLGVNLEDVTTKASLADAFVVALERTGTSIVKKG